MTPDLDERLRRHAVRLDQRITEAKSAPDHDALHVPIGENLNSGRRAFRAGRMRALSVAACVAVAVAGLVALSTREPRADDTGPAAVPETRAPADTSVLPVEQRTEDLLEATPEIEIEPAYDENQSPPWDNIAIAPGTLTWFDITTTNLPEDLKAQLGERGVWSDAYVSTFYRCVSWQVDNDRPVCDRLAGSTPGGIDYGDALTVGSALTDSTPDQLLWELADGSLWGYETYDSPPAPTPIRIAGQNDGVVYRVDDEAYTVWQQAPGALVWFKTKGLDGNQIATLAQSMQPAQLEQLPLLLSLGATIGERIPQDQQVKLGWIAGRPCVGINMWQRCTPIDQGPVLLTGETSVGLGPSIAAVTPDDAQNLFVVDLFEIGEQPVEPTFNGFGLNVSLYPAGTERLLSGRLVDAQGATLLSHDFGLESISNGFAPDLVAEGRTSSGRAWVVLRQNPDNPPTSSEASRYGLGGYCWLLFEGTEGFAPLCPPTTIPDSGLGSHADYRDQLDVVEVAADVSEVQCDGLTLPIYTDPQLNNRRFVVAPCDQPTSTLDNGQRGPSTRSDQAPPLDNADDCPTYTIVAGDYPVAIAEEFGVNVDDFIDRNQQSTFNVGDEVVIPC